VARKATSPDQGANDLAQRIRALEELVEALRKGMDRTRGVKAYEISISAPMMDPQMIFASPREFRGIVYPACS